MNLSDARARVCDDLSRPETEIGDFVERQIQSAIDHYTPFRFHFNEKLIPVTLTLTSVYSLEAIARNASAASQVRIYGPNAAYGLLDNQVLTLSSGQYYAKIIEIDTFEVEHSSTRKYEIDPIGWGQMVAMRSTPLITGDPSRYARYDEKLWLDATPSSTMSAALYAHVQFLPLEDSPNTTNPWLVDGLELILARAARMTAQKKLLDAEQAMAFRDAENEALASLVDRANKYVSSGLIRPSL